MATHQGPCMTVTAAFRTLPMQAKQGLEGFSRLFLDSIISLGNAVLCTRWRSIKKFSNSARQSSRDELSCGEEYQRVCLGRTSSKNGQRDESPLQIAEQRYLKLEEPEKKFHGHRTRLEWRSRSSGKHRRFFLTFRAS